MKSSGTLTFLFSDIESSTRLWESFPEAMKTALERHDQIFQQAIETNRGVVIKSTGDGFHAAFESAQDAVLAALDAQNGLSKANWDAIQPYQIRSRIGLHTGEAVARGGDYYGSTLNRAARLMAIGHGGQILASTTVADLVRDELPAEVSLIDLGEHRLKDLVRPERVYQIRRPDLKSEFPPLNSLDAYPNNLPVQLTSFVGRDHEMNEVKQILGISRLVTLIGPGGTGKTRLALQVAADLIPRFNHGVWLAELAVITDPKQVVELVASVFELRELPGGPPLISILTGYLRSRQVLLILDNCEHLVEACAHLSDTLLRACPQMKILASSREGLGITGEVIFRVPSLSLPGKDRMNPDELIQSESVQLFVERATAANSRFSLNEHNALAVARICQRLDGIPLALELSAARIRAFTPDQIAARLDDRFRLLTGGSRTALPRQQTLRALIDWSYDLLSVEEQRLFRTLSVFMGGWTLEAAEFVSGGLDVLSVLPNLVNKSLVVINEDIPAARYFILETIRQYAREKLFDQGEIQETRNRHLDYYLELSKTVDERILRSNTITWIDELSAEMENVRQAFEWAREQRPADGLRLVGNIIFLLLLWGNLVEVRGWIQDSLERVSHLPTTDLDGTARLRLRARGLLALGQIYLNLGEIQNGRLVLIEAADIARRLQEKPLLGLALGMLSIAYFFLNDPNGVREAAMESIEFARQAGDTWGLAMASGPLAWAEGVQGNEARRKELIAEAMATIGQSNNLFTADGLMFLGFEARSRGHLDEALLYFTKSQRFTTAIRSRPYEAMIASELAHIRRLHGDDAAAYREYRKTILLWKELGHLPAVAHQLECFAFLARHAGQPLRALRLLGAAEALRETVNSSRTDYEQVEYETELELLRPQVDEQAWEIAWSAGRKMSVDEAVAIALEEGNSVEQKTWTKTSL
ncbi:MAG TPA: adenylate/guanylate cyclase domain-containing protein [Anaerolineaceae bacterium]|nr:adenylate/guanylate cyclase domain-containing protein [Anaerolineaceae bacterium]